MMDENFNNDLASKFMNSIFDEYLPPLISKIANKIKITYNEVKIDLEIPFQAYLTKSYEKYSKTKTQAEISHIWDINFISLLYFGL